MGETPSPLDKKRLSRAGIAGVVLAVVGIGMFVLLYSALSSVEPLQRLLLSLCIPPVVMATVLGGYLLLTGRRDT